MLARKIIWTEEPAENPAENPEKIEMLFGSGYTLRDFYSDRLPYFISFEKIDDDEYILIYAVNYGDYIDDVFQTARVTVLSESETVDVPEITLYNQ